MAIERQPYRELRERERRQAGRHGGVPETLVVDAEVSEYMKESKPGDSSQFGNTSPHL